MKSIMNLRKKCFGVEKKVQIALYIMLSHSIVDYAHILKLKTETQLKIEIHCNH